VKLKNELFADQILVSSFGELRFDKEGFVVEPKLTEEVIKEIAKLGGFEIVTEKAVEPKKVEKVEEPKEATKEPEKVAEVAPKEEAKEPEKAEKTEVSKRQKRKSSDK